MKVNTVCLTWCLQTAREERQVCGVVWIWVETLTFTVELQTNMHGPHPSAHDQLLCHHFLYHADRDWCWRIRFLRLYIAKESPLFLKNIKGLERLLSHHSILSWKQTGCNNLQTKIRSCFPKSSFSHCCPFSANSKSSFLQTCSFEVSDLFS